MTVLLFLVVFVLACDQNALKILHRPIIACTLIGALMQDMKTGIIVGSSLELVYVVYESQSDSPFIRNGGFLLSSIAGCVLAISGGLDTSSAMSGAISCTTIGAFIDYLLSDVNVVFLPMARSAAEKGDEKKLALANFLPMILNGIVYGVLAVVAYSLGESVSEQFTAIQTNYGWILSSLTMAGMLIPCVGYAILLRNIGTKDVAGALLAGVACGAVLVMISMHSTSLLLVSLLAFSIAVYDYHANTKKKETSGKEEDQPKMKNTIKGGAEKWW